MKQFTPFIIAGIAILGAMITTGLISCATTTYPAKALHFYKIEPEMSLSTPLESIENIYNSTVSIMGERDKKLIVGAAGVVVKHKKGQQIDIITAHHVVRGIWKRQGKGTIIRVGSKRLKWIMYTYVVGYKKAHDLALLRTVFPAAEDGPSVELAKKTPPIGKSVWVIGSPARMERNVTRGILSNIVTVKNVQYYRTDAAIFFGNSGGGMFTTKGKLIGIMHSISSAGLFGGIVPGSGRAIALPHIRNFLDMVLK